MSGYSPDDEDLLIPSSNQPKLTTISPSSPRNNCTILSDFLGKWKQIKTIGIEEYIKEEGGGWLYRKLVASIKPTLEIKKITKK